MASISGLGGTSSSGLYGNRNVISGLASGLDTEAMIENSVLGYKNKITGLNQQQTTLQWKQDSFRSLISKMVNMSKKYTSFTSSTNLFSSTFFNRAVTTTTTGANASKVSATGKTNSSVTIDAIKQLATSTKYTVGGGSLSGTTSQTGPDGTTLTSKGETIDWSQNVQVSDMAGSMTFAYGNKTVELNFGELDVYDSAEALAKGIREKLDGQYITTSSGEYVKASSRIDVSVSNSGEISFSDKSGAGNEVYIASASSAIKDTLGITPDKTANKFTVSDPSKLSHEAEMTEYLSGKTIDLTLNGVTKKIEIPTLGQGETTDSLAQKLNTAIADKFGAGKVLVESTTSGALSFTTEQGSTLSVQAETGKLLGMGENGVTNYVNTGKKLGELLGSNFTEGDLVINGVSIGTFGKDTSLESVLVAINGNTEAGVSVSYSKLTDQFSFVASESGAASNIKLGGSLASIFGVTEDASGNEVVAGTTTAGRDAIFTATVNGDQMEFSRSSNVVDMDGLSVTLQETFGYEKDANGVLTPVKTEAISFATKSDSDKIISAIESFVKDYNELVTELRSAYATRPATKSNGSKYAPLTDEDRADMSESAIKDYEEKAKQGVLFGDKNLSSLYSKLRTAITPTGADGNALRAMGITTKYEDGLTTLSLDTNALRSALETNPDSVRDAFTKTAENGAGTDGLMQNIKKTLEDYSSTSVAAPGILVRHAGTPLSSNSLRDNTLQKQFDNLSDLIDTWQSRMSTKVDYYTKQFTALEQLMAQMNSQSSQLAGLMGG